MKKQRKRIYTALLCTCFLFSTASVLVSAAETEQEEEMTTLSSRSGEAEVSTAADLTSALGDSTKDTVKLTADIIIDTTLTVKRAVTLDLNGFVLRMTGEGSVIKVEQGGELTIADSDTNKAHKFAQNTDGLWVLVDDSSTSSKTVKGGIITGGKAQNGGGVYVAPDGKLHMTGGSIVGCQARYGGGVYLDNNDQTGGFSEFTMTDSRIIGCTASDNGGGVAVDPACKFTMDNGSEIRSCTARMGGGVYINGGDFSRAKSLSGKLVITFDPNNGGNSSRQEVVWSKNGAKLIAPIPKPTKEGHTFEGWYYDNNGENTEWDFETDRAKYTMRLTAKWKANIYNVTVENDGNGTASADPASAKMGAEVSLTAMPKSGYHFKEWKVISGDVEIEDNKFTMPADNVTVKAIFERNASSGGSGGGGGGTTYYTLTFETNGGDSMQAIRAARGKTLDLSAYTPMRDGYDFGGWYADAALTQRITEIKLSGSKTVYADWKKREPNEPDAVKNPFADVNAGDWFYRDVLFSYEKGLMSGMDAAAFAPYANTTRAQIAVIFYRMEGSPAVEGENSFTDVVRGSGTAWFYDAVTWAQQNGIMGGYGNSSFAPNDPITREQLAAIFYRYAQYKGYDTTQGGMAIREFDDYESISDYAMGAMAWAVNTGLVKGDSNLLYPKGTATRAEIAALFHRFAENGMK